MMRVPAAAELVLLRVPSKKISFSGQITSAYCGPSCGRQNQLRTGIGLWLTRGHRPKLANTPLLQISHGRQVELARRDESGAAPGGAEPTQIDPGEVAREPRRVVAGEGVAVTLVVVRVVVPQVEREHALGDADADVPGSVAVVGNAV